MNRKINIHNYEEFFIDYLDGNLSNQEIIELENFLLANPELRNELEGIENTIISPDKITFPHPENMKQIELSLPVSVDNFDFFCVAELEGDLNEEQKAAFNDYLKNNPAKNKDFQLISQTYLKGDEKIKYPDKGQLKKSVFVVYRREMLNAVAIAAGIMLLLLFWSNFINSNPDLNKLASSDSSDEKNETTEIVDTTSAKNQMDQNTDELETKPTIPEKTKDTDIEITRTISFKTGIPIASVDPDYEESSEIEVVELSRDKIMNKIKIDPLVLSNTSPLLPVSNDPINKNVTYEVKSPKIAADPAEYISLQEFAVQKLTDLIFRGENKNLDVINIASLGVEKINDFAGTNMKLEASANEGSGTRILSFNSKLLSFSTPINREN